MRKYLFVASLFFLALAQPQAGLAATLDQPGKGVELKPARATWNTGFFQEALVRRGLEELGYKVDKPKDLSNPIFYKSLALGDVDYWTNGWFPIHDSQMPDSFYEKGDTYGYVVKAGAIQGYLVSKKDAEKFGISSLDDFKRPEVKKAFDRNRDGKADLTACPPGWGCYETIGHHLKVYGLADHINPITASYEASMASTLAAYRSGEPVLFYTWGPNWTLYKFKPGKDVVWINVPETKPSPVQEPLRARMEASGIEGAVSDPVKLGFVVNDIRIVANKNFIAKNPAAKTLFEVFTLPLDDLNAQNTRMDNGEKSEEDIARHVDEWIAKNKSTWDGWLQTARKAAQ